MPAAMASPAKTVLACTLLAAALFAGCSKLEQGTEDEPPEGSPSTSRASSTTSSSRGS